MTEMDDCTSQKMMDWLEPISPAACVALSDDEILSFSLKALNSELKSIGLSKNDAKSIKQRRKMLKSRSYSASRNYKIIDHMVSCEKGQEYEDMEQIQEENDKMREELSLLHKKYLAFINFAKEQKIPLPTEVEPELDLEHEKSMSKFENL